MKSKKILVVTLFASLVLLSQLSAPVWAWNNGGYTEDGNWPRFGTHDWIALHAVNWLPEEERWWIVEYLDQYLLGTELPDNGGHHLGIGDKALHHVYYDSSENLVDNSSAARALAEFNLALEFLNEGNYSAAALHAGVMSHYIVDVGVFGHVMGAGTDWGAEVHHADYENCIETRTDEYPTDDFSIYLSYDGTLSEIDTYNATLDIAYDTTFDVDGDLTCVWMDTNYDWNNQAFVDRAGESINLCVNVLADVLHTLYSRMNPDVTIASFKALFANREVIMIHPSFSQSKPLGVKAAMVSDWTASEYIYVKLENVTEGLDTDSRFVNQTTGKAYGASGTGIITFGGPDVNLVVYYAENNDYAPIHFIIGSDRFYFRHSNGTDIPGADLPKSVINHDQDMFVIEIFKDKDDRYVMIIQGFGWQGTYAGGKYFEKVIYPDLSSYKMGWMILKWEDTNGDGFVNTPDEGDTYTLIAHDTTDSSGYENWAVIVGVADYVGTDNDLLYTDDDAIDIYNTLISYPEWQADHIRVLLDADANKSDILDAIDWLVSNADSEDKVLFFFSGHGTYGPDVAPYDETDGYDEYICPHDLNHIRDDELDTALDQIESNAITVIIDACFSGGMIKSSRNILVKTLPKPRVSISDGFRKDIGEAGRVVLLACDDDEYSWSYPDLQNGVFSYYVVEGLNGAADANANGKVSAEETFNYAMPRVQNYTGGVQNPQMYDGYGGELEIVRASAKPVFVHKSGQLLRHYNYIGEVVDLGGAGEFDDTWVASFCLVKIDDVYYGAYEAKASNGTFSIGRTKTIDIESVPYAKDGRVRNSSGGVIYNPVGPENVIVPDTFADCNVLYIHYDKESGAGEDWRARYLSGDFSGNSMAVSVGDLDPVDSYPYHNNVAHIGGVNGRYAFLMQSGNPGLNEMRLRLYMEQPRVDPFASLSFGGIIHYEGTESPPEDVSGITVGVELNGKEEGATSTIDSAGRFTISGVSAEGSAGSYSYMVYSVTDQSSEENRTVTVVVGGYAVSGRGELIEDHLETGKKLTIADIPFSPKMELCLWFSILVIAAVIAFIIKIRMG